jgi:hypothetical protein
MKKSYYKRFLLQGGMKPKVEKILSEIKDSYSQTTLKILAKYQDGKEMLYSFHFWILPSHHSSEIRLSSFSSNLYL